MSRVQFAGLTLVGEQKITLTGTAVTAINSTCKGGSYLVMSVEVASVRVRFGGTAPAASTGILYPAGVHELPYYNGTSLLRFTAASGSPLVNIASFQRVGEV